MNKQRTKKKATILITLSIFLHTPLLFAAQPAALTINPCACEVGEARLNHQYIECPDGTLGLKIEGDVCGESGPACDTIRQPEWTGPAGHRYLRKERNGNWEYMNINGCE